MRLRFTYKVCTRESSMVMTMWEILLGDERASPPTFILTLSLLQYSFSIELKLDVAFWHSEHLKQALWITKVNQKNSILLAYSFLQQLRVIDECVFFFFYFFTTWYISKVLAALGCSSYSFLERTSIGSVWNNKPRPSNEMATKRKMSESGDLNALTPFRIQIT